MLAHLKTTEDVYLEDSAVEDNHDDARNVEGSERGPVIEFIIMTSVSIVIIIMIIINIIIIIKIIIIRGRTR